MPAASASATRTYCGSGFFRITATYITGRKRKACTICETQTVAMNSPSDVIAPERSSSSSSALAIRQQTPIGAYLSTRECMISATNLLTCMSASRYDVENPFQGHTAGQNRMDYENLNAISYIYADYLVADSSVATKSFERLQNSGRSVRTLQ